MRYAVISDVHANLQALEAVLKDAREQGADAVVCLGDVVGYGPLPGETLRRVRSVAQTVIAGNHDDAVSGRGGADDFIDLAADAVARHRAELSEDELAWLRSLPYTAELEGAVAAHGDFTDPPAFRYVADSETVSANFAATPHQLMFVGHTHLPGVYLVGDSGRFYRIGPEDFTLEDNKRYIVNPGSVGYPRESDGQCHSSYVLYDSAERTIQFRLLPFTVASVMQRGAGPRTLRKRILAAAILAAALASGGLALLLAPHEERVVERKTVVERTVYDDDPALVAARETLTLPKGARCVRAGYKLERGSDLADLYIVFRAADGSDLQVLKSTPRSSANQAVKIPPRAISADFIVRRHSPSEHPRLKSFNPGWE